MSEEQYVTRAEFLLLVTRVDTCETDRKEIRKEVSTLSADVAEVKAEVKSLSTKQDAQTLILERLDKVMTGIAADPKVRLLAQLIIAALLAWLTSKVPQ